MYVRMYVCIYIYIYIYMYTCIHVIYDIMLYYIILYDIMLYNIIVTQVDSLVCLYIPCIFLFILLTWIFHFSLNCCYPFWFSCIFRFSRIFRLSFHLFICILLFYLVDSAGGLGGLEQLPADTAS